MTPNGKWLSAKTLNPLESYTALSTLIIVIIIIYRFLSHKKYVLSNSESVQCNFFIFDHVTFIQFKICCCVKNFIKIGLFFTEIWRYIDFQDGGCRPPFWSCFTIIRHHPRSTLLAAAACRISCQSDTQIWKYSYLNFSHIRLEMPIHAPQNGGYGGLWKPTCDYSSLRPPKGTSLLGCSICIDLPLSSDKSWANQLFK